MNDITTKRLKDGLYSRRWELSVGMVTRIISINKSFLPKEEEAEIERIKREMLNETAAK